MNTSTFFGFICPKCTTSITFGIGGEPVCPNCGTRMIPNKNATPVAMNVHCKKCNSSFQMIDSDTCPECGTKFE